MGCGDSQTEEDFIMGKPTNSIDNSPYEAMEKIANPKAWERFITWPHVPREEGNTWKEGKKTVEELEAPQVMSKDKYLGSWDTKGKKPDGFGVLFEKSSGSIYQGFFEGGKLNGTGILFHGKGKEGKPGKISKGIWAKGIMNGEAKIEYADKEGHFFTGTVKNNERTGNGTETFAGGEKIEMKWTKDKKEGKGTWTLGDGTVNEGVWLNDQKHGHFKVTNKDDVSYKSF
jgi:hypothetical protein